MWFFFGFFLFAQQPSLTTLNSRAYTERISLFLFLLHLVAAVGLVCFLIFKGIQGLIQASESIKTKEKRVLQFYLPQVEAASFLSITLALAWQKGQGMGFIYGSFHTMELFCNVPICWNSPYLLPKTCHWRHWSIFYCLCNWQWIVCLLGHNMN